MYEINETNDDINVDILKAIDEVEERRKIYVLNPLVVPGCLDQAIESYFSVKQ